MYPIGVRLIGVHLEHRPPQVGSDDTNVAIVVGDKSGSMPRLPDIALGGVVYFFVNVWALAVGLPVEV
jgi:hypothetical protein